MKSDKRMTKKQKVILGQMVIYSGLEQYKVDGYFYRSNKDLCNDCGITEKTLITGLLKLEQLGYISRRTGIRGKASEYTVNSTVNCTVKITNCTKNYSENTKNYSEKLQCNSENYSTDTDIEKDIENININLKALLDQNNQLRDKIDQLEGRLDKASEVVRTLKKRIRVLEENNNNSTPDKGTTGKGTVKVNKDNSQFEMYNREFTELVAVMKDKTSTRDKIISTAAQIEYMIVNGMLNSKQVKYGQDLISQYRDNVKADQNQVKSSTVNKPTPQVAHTPLPTVWIDQRLEEDWNGFYRRYNRINSGEMFEDLAVDTLESAELIKKYIDNKLLPEPQTKWFNHYWMLDGDRKKGLTSKVEADCRSFLNMPNEFKERYDKALEAEIPNENLAVSE